MDADELATCMECVYGKSTDMMCARDNFSIRPEAFLINIDDQNQTNPTNPLTPPQRLTNGFSGVVVPTTPNKLNLAAGYQYKLEINATNHTSNEASPGYHFHLGAAAGGTGVAGTNADYIWSPDPLQTVSDCNDTVRSEERRVGKECRL